MIETIDSDQTLNKKIANYLGLAQKAGKIAAGDMAVLTAIKKGKAKLILIASDIAPSVKKELEAELDHSVIPVYVWEDKIYLGSIIGKSKRGALAVLDKGFADVIEKLFLT